MLNVLDFVIDNNSFDYSRAAKEEGSDLIKTILLKTWLKLEALELIETIRMVSKAKM